MAAVLESTANEIILAALLDSGIIRPDEIPTSEDTATALSRLNTMTKRWQAQGHHLWAQTEGIAFMDQGKESYFLGPSGDEATTVDDFIGTTTTADLAADAVTISVDSTEGMLGASEQISIDPISTQFWAAGNGGILSAISGNLSVANGSDGASFADFTLDVEVGKTYRVTAVYSGGTSPSVIEPATIFGTGANIEGGLGTGNTDSTFVFTAADTTDFDWIAVSVGEEHSCAINADGEIFSSGLNFSGQLGLGNEIDKLFFTQESSGATNWDSISAGLNFTSAMAGGKIFGTGLNEEGELGLGTTSNVDVFTQETLGATNWTAAVSGETHQIALNANGEIYTVGENFSGQLGQGGTSNLSTFTKVGSATDWVAIGAGFDTSFAIKSDGTLHAAGLNGSGQLGLGDLTDRDVFTQVGTDTNWVAVEASEFSAYAQKVDGSWYATGLNVRGQLGIGSTIDKDVFTLVLGGNDWTTFSAASFSALALKSDGSFWGVGWNFDGQLGQGDNDDRFETFISLSDSIGWSAIAEGLNDSLGIFSTPSTKLSIIDPVTGEDLQSETTDTLGDVVLEFTATQTEMSFRLSNVLSAATASVAISSLNFICLSDGDFIGIKQDDNTRHWTTIVEVVDDTTLEIDTGMVSAVTSGAQVFTFTDLIERPMRIYNERTETIGQNNEIPSYKWSRQEYMQQTIKDSQGTVIQMYYNPELGNGRLYVWQTAADCNQVVNFTFDRPLQVSDDQLDSPDFPSEWFEALKWNLAVQLLSGYAVDQNTAQLVMANAQSSLEEALDFDEETGSLYVQPRYDR
jgi:alpha-tubulin suppressor-like RCC1 family protein